MVDETLTRDEEISLEERQVVVFKVGEEEFGVSIMEVREIIRMESITPIPNSAPYIEGLINNRGGVIVVINLASKLGMEKKEEDSNTRIIVIEINGGTIGMIVDSATEVLRLTKEHIKPAPSIITEKIDASFIEGVGIIEERLLILLDLAKVITPEEANAMSNMTQNKSDSKDSEISDSEEKVNDNKSQENSETVPQESQPSAKENPEKSQESENPDNNEQILQKVNDQNINNTKESENPVAKPSQESDNKETEIPSKDTQLPKINNKEETKKQPKTKKTAKTKSKKESNPVKKTSKKPSTKATKIKKSKVPSASNSKKSSKTSSKKKSSSKKPKK